ncbi:hypothetical protein OAI07_00750 [Akkermansiaceae bacterium]|nr:hypothetical protein [Akkermansiaceae bacterium]
MKILPTTIFILILSVVGCNEPKIDTSTDEKMKASISEVRESLPENKRKEFEEALDAVAFSGIDLKDVFSAAQADTGAIERKMKEAFNGKTGIQVIELAKEINQKSSNDSTSKKVADRPQSKHLPVIKLGDSVVIDGINITLNSCRLGGIIEDKKSDSYISYKIPEGDFIQIKVTFENVSERKLVTIQDVWGETKLMDDADNFYRNKDMDDLKNQVTGILGSVRIKPGEKLVDTLFFEAPLKGWVKLKVESNPNFYRSTGDGLIQHLSDESFTFEITDKDISK